MDASRSPRPRFDLPPMTVWAVRELMRRPAASALLAAALGTLALLTAGVLLVSEALDRNTATWIDQGPAIVVRRIGADGFRPLPAAEAIRIAAAVPGVTVARVRLWGTAATDTGPVTVMGDDAWLRAHLWRRPAAQSPGPGEAFSGLRSPPPAAGSMLTVRGARAVTVRIAGSVMPGAPAAFGDLLLLAPEDTRRVLGFGAGEATDLALDVFHPAEADAIGPELAAAFPWPVSILTRSEMHRWYAAGFGRRSALVLLMYVPALLALGLVVLDAAALPSGARQHIGLLKALGWTTADVVRLQMRKALILGLPAVALGLAAAASLVWSPWSTWLARALLGWRDAFPGTTIQPAAALLIVLEVGALIFLPFLAANLWPALASAVASPDDLLRQEM